MANYSFFLGQGGGSGGGSGGFAIIKIEYPAGSTVTVTFNSVTTTAPDTSGIWMYGCEAIGTYTIAISGTSVSKTVQITTQGQIETVWISSQTINYALIYYLGNEFTDPSDAEKKYAIKTSGWNIETHVGADKKIVTASNIQTPENCKLFWYTKCGLNASNKVTYSISSNSIYRSDNLGAAFTLGASTFTANYIANICRDRSVGSATISFLKQSNNIYGYLVSADASIQVFACGVVLADDISVLSAYGSTISAILSNATALFDDQSSLQKMCSNCTGDFMISALNNSNFVNVMNNSPNKSILIANEHWNRFIALLSAS